MHAEDEELMKATASKYKGDNDPYIHAKIRTSEVEVSAVKKAVSLMNNGNVHFTHISAGASLDIIKAKGVSCDVTPHHLFLDASELKKQGNLVKMNPALKGKEDVEALWRGIEDGVVKCIGTDHAGHTLDEKEADYWDAPSGVPGLETMLPLLLDAVNKNRISLQKVVELVCSNPVTIFGVKNKGKIEKGMDGDLTIVDMNLEKEVKNEELYTKSKWSPFNGWKLKGWPVFTIVGGKIAFDGEIRDVRGSEVVT